MKNKILAEIEKMESLINSVSHKLLSLKHEYLKSKGWDVQLIDEFAEIYFYMKGSHNVTCEDEAMRIEENELN